MIINDVQKLIVAPGTVGRCRRWANASPWVAGVLRSSALLLIAVAAPWASANAQPVIPVSGYGNYCSKTWPGGGSAFGYVSTGGDPCQFIDSLHTGTLAQRNIFQFRLE